MIELFKMGGSLFMSLISVCQIGLFLFIVLHLRGKTKLSQVQEWGTLSLAIGVLGQLIGLYSAFDAAQIMGTISTSMLMGGLKVSMITTLYGLIGFAISRVYSLLAQH